MKTSNRLSILFAFCLLCLAVSCSPSPEESFGAAVLNSNLLVGFAADGPARELDQPSSMLVEGSTDKTRTMSRKEVVDMKINSIEDAYKKVKGLTQNDDNNDIVEASKALYEYILPVYKNEYQQLAKLYDQGAPPEEIKTFTASIHNKHAGNFEQLYKKLIANGKLYAQKHNIKVNWAD